MTFYTADWPSLDSRPIPEWYQNARFGIFIHWGLYSVPAWAPQGEYAEWYWQKLRSSKSPNPWRANHDKLFGAGFGYEKFAEQFRAEMFDADQWAELFRRAGAGYVVLTSKHHDGYCLWPSPEAEKHWGRRWNARDGAPRRDLVGELAHATRAQQLKFGLYYSLYEWFNPLWLADRARYVSEHMIPQFKRLVKSYSPSLVFADGEWDLTSDEWRSPELLRWLYNEAPSADDVVVNDRWGKDCRHKHGGYFTTEYGAGLPNAARPWEENRGLGKSFGYNRAETLDDYMSARELVFVFCDLISRGGNLLLNVGPTADGRIPVIMQDRLAEIGAWLDVNGEAVRGARAAERSCQWSEGTRPDQAYGEFQVKFEVMDVVGAEPRAGEAKKQLWFSRKGRELYAITTGWLKPRVAVKGVIASPSTRVTMLGRPGDLPFAMAADGIVIEVDSLTPESLPCKHAWTFRITDATLLPE